MHTHSASYSVRIGIKIVSVLLLLVFILVALGNALAASASSDSMNAIIRVAEGDDYATQVLAAPWDMAEYSDVSQYMNRSGNANIMTGINVTNGVFSGRSTDSLASFSMLFPGYDNALYVGKIGHNYPINANKYSCVYVAAKVDTQPAAQWDQMFFWWFANEKLNGPGGTWGAATYKLYDSLPNPNPHWKLIKADLAKSSLSNYTAWSAAPNGQWQGLFISPSAQNTTWAIDWVRLTDCDSTGHTFSIVWAGANASVYVRPAGTSRDILIESGVTAHPYQFDTQGLQAGSYTYYVRNGTTDLATGQFEVVATPIVTIEKPSYTSGVDYATQAGQPWDMSQNSVTGIDCMTYNYANGVLDMTTIHAPNQSAECLGGGYGNPAIHLKTSGAIDPKAYRYMTFRMNNDGPWQNVPLGHIVRWIWYMQSTSGQPANRCWYISYGVPLDVGWHTYTMDLWDSHQGGVDETSVVECPAGPYNWKSSPPVLEVRIKPNENITGSNMIQHMDWVTLTQMDTVKSGNPFTVKLTTSKDISRSQFSLYYTTDRSNPKMQPITFAGTTSDSGNLWLLDRAKLYLPILVVSEAAPLQFQWNTTGVAAGEYYICAVANDGYHSAPYCSEAPVLVTP